MSALQNKLSISGLGFLIAGCGMGVSVKDVNIVDTNFSTSVGITMRDNQELRGVFNSVGVVADVKLSYEAGYDINFTTVLGTPYPILSVDGVGVSFEDCLGMLISDDNNFTLDLHHKLIDVKPYISVSIIAKNDDVIDWLDNQMMIFSTAPYLDKTTSGDEVEVGKIIHIQEDDAKGIVDEIQDQIGHGIGVREEKNGVLSNEVIVSIKQAIKTEVARVFALPHLTY